MKPSRNPRGDGLMLSALPAGLALGSGGLLGLVLGLIGGGGSILVVPLLVYLVGMPSPHAAIGTAALAVAVNAAAGLGLHARRARIRWPCALVFSVAGAAGAFVGAAVGKAVDGQQLLALFGLLMVLVGVLMLRPKPQTAHARRGSRAKRLPTCCRVSLSSGSAWDCSQDFSVSVAAS